MKVSSFILCGLLGVAAFFSVEVASQVFKESEKEFENEFGIKYAYPEDEEQAAKALASAEKQVNDANKSGGSEKEALYSFSDLPQSVFEKEKLGENEFPQTPYGRGLGLIMPPESEWYTDPELERLYNSTDRQYLPAEYDSDSMGLVTVPKNQYTCGSCSAFAVTTLIETCMLKAGAQLDNLDLSEQFVLDCGYNAGSMNGCRGAQPGAYADFYANNLHQSPHEFDYPYQNTNPRLSCPRGIRLFNSGAGATKAMSDFYCNEERMKQLVYQFGSVQTGIFATDRGFENYKYGVASGCSSKQTNHAVTVVGYGVENGQPYWKVKNSWGPQWGEGGFIKLRRGTTECGIASTCTVMVCARSYGTPSKPPTPPTPSESTCDVNKLFGKNVTGKFRFRVKDIESEVTCDNSICKSNVVGTANACIYICGKESCEKN